MSDIDIRIRSARVQLEATDFIPARAASRFYFGDLLEAVQRVAGAALEPDAADEVRRALTTLGNRI